jgi:hypothetical protein
VAGQCETQIVLDVMNAGVMDSNSARGTDVPSRMRVYPKVSGLAAWRENCKWLSSLPLGAVVSLFYESV